ncbi:MAG: hypothetical protein ACXQTE_05185 [Methanosarcinaceae archaeon]
MVVNLPSVVGLTGVSRSEEEITPFATNLYRYCEKKGIDPSDYIFEEFGLITSGLGLVAGMIIEYKAERKEKKEGKKARVDPGLGVSDSYTLSKQEEPEQPEARPTNAIVVGGI